MLSSHQPLRSSEPSKPEAQSYYAGLPSNPILVYRSGSTPWTRPSGPEAYRKLKELRPVFGHKLATVWSEVAPNIITYLDSAAVLWTSIDVVRFAMVEQADVVGPTILCIGVVSGTLLASDAESAACSCLGILERFGIFDIEVEFRESVYTTSARTTILNPVFDSHPTADVRGPLTAALGLSITAEATPDIEGTGGLYLTESGGSGEKLFLLIARHVLLPSDGEQNVDYAYANDSEPRRNVLLLGTKAYDRLLRSVSLQIGRHRTMIESHREAIKRIVDRNAERGVGEHGTMRGSDELAHVEKLLGNAIKATESLEGFRDEITTNWSQKSQRVLGHIIYSPRITHGGSGSFCEDYAIVELDRSKLGDAYKDNVIDLGTIVPAYNLLLTMNCADAGDMPTGPFEYPYDRLFHLQDIVTEKEMHSPAALDNFGEPCLMVLKHGSATGLTVGRATSIFSHVREYLPDGTSRTFVAWPILPNIHSTDLEFGAFSAPGDSGAIIADGSGRIGGMITGGAGKEGFLDVTYATPFYWLMQRMNVNGFSSGRLVVA